MRPRDRVEARVPEPLVLVARGDGQVKRERRPVAARRPRASSRAGRCLSRGRRRSPPRGLARGRSTRSTASTWRGWSKSAGCRSSRSSWPGDRRARADSDGDVARLNGVARAEAQRGRVRVRGAAQRRAASPTSRSARQVLAQRRRCRRSRGRRTRAARCPRRSSTRRPASTEAIVASASRPGYSAAARPASERSGAREPRRGAGAPVLEPVLGDRVAGVAAVEQPVHELRRARR